MDNFRVPKKPAGASRPARPRLTIEGVMAQSSLKPAAKMPLAPKAVPHTPIPHAAAKRPQSLDGTRPPQPKQQDPMPPGLPKIGATIASRTAATAVTVSSLPRKAMRTRKSKAKAGDKTATGAAPRARWKKLVLRAVLILLAVGVLFGGWMGYKVYHNGSKIFGGASILGLLNSTKLNGEDRGRVNILLAGTSEDDPGHPGGDLTDSIMLVSLDTNNHTASMVSIPRDLWVELPGYAVHQKINAVNHYGEQNNFQQDGYPAGGLGYLEKVVEQVTGQTINYYVKVDYAAFRDTVNAVGGITVDIQSSDKRGLYDPNIAKVDGGPLKLANGPQQLNGQTALNLARARGDHPYSYGFPGSDFDRTAHQRQMLVALKDKALSTGVLANPSKLSSLLDAVGKNIKTDLKPSEIRRIYDLGKQVESSNIRSAGITSLIQNYAAPDGSSALAPKAGLDDYTKIQEYLKLVLRGDAAAIETPTVVVLNGTDATGVATKKAAELRAKGFEVLLVTDATAKYPATVVVDQTKGAKPLSKKLLEQLAPGATTTDPQALKNAGFYTVDFVVILGGTPASTSAPATTQ